MDIKKQHEVVRSILGLLRNNSLEEIDDILAITIRACKLLHYNELSKEEQIKLEDLLLARL